MPAQLEMLARMRATEIRAERKAREQDTTRRAVGDAVRRQSLDLDREDVKDLLDDLFDDCDDYDRPPARSSPASVRPVA